MVGYSGDGRRRRLGGVESNRALEKGWKRTAVRGAESYRRKERAARGMSSPPRRYIHGLKTEVPPLFAPSPRSCVVPAYPRGMLRSLRHTDTVNYRHRNTHSALIQTDNAPRRTAYRESRKRQEINNNRWKYNNPTNLMRQ